MRCFDVLWWNLVRDVGNDRLWVDRKNRAFDSANEIIGSPEVSEQSNNGENGRYLPLLPVLLLTLARPVFTEGRC